MKRERVFWGLVLILGGVFLIISKLGYFPDINVFSLLLTILLAVIILKSLIRVNFPGILFPIAFISIIYDDQLGITSITPWTVLVAALLGSIGLSMIFHRHSKWMNTKYIGEEHKFEEISIEDGSQIRFKNSFGASIKYVNTDDFQQAHFDSSFGAMKVYFDNAVIRNENAVVRINASFSGIELYMPRTWKIEDKTSVFLGSISEKNKNDNPTKTLTLVGDISFSGVEVIYI
ncbi:LiaF transmembrane domain-containing protein [Clostridium cellulovorans]|uniref:LiaF transmembrane domain-containing protein n=1 Tax=Clostridium cellulovorans (strain ATCC 35296 / DSM 3052 / OCM 3 / 743B) TaxID=573061 RepID=D9SNH3_CLOC7|nr:membrane protein [Clostridium cellulovorans]ADL53965.1 hypothetical protein Clocel_4308 [Clostridium cellulovorans 743B]